MSCNKETRMGVICSDQMFVSASAGEINPSSVILRAEHSVENTTVSGLDQTETCLSSINNWEDGTF